MAHKNIAERKLIKYKNEMLKSMAKHGFVYAGIFLFTYWLVLKIRVYYGYFDYPILTSIAELNWFFIGIALMSAFGIGAVHGAVKHKRKKK